MLGVWAGTRGAGESAKYWTAILTELKNRGVNDIFFLVTDGLKGMPDSVEAIFPQTIVQTCIIHLMRNTFKYASKKYRGEIAKDLKPIYTAPSRHAAWSAFEQFEQKWGTKYPAISGLWLSAWEQFTPFLDYDVEIRKVLCSTNAIVIRSPLGAVLHVHHERREVRGLRRGSGYLPRSMTLIFRRNDACPAGPVTGLAA